MTPTAEVLQANPYEKVLRKVWDQHVPFITLWELTYKCNLKCVHCYTVTDHEKRELTLEECRPILDQLAAEGCLFIIFTGGEILLRSDFFDIAQYARQKGFAIRLFTNGTLITPEVADRIQELQPIHVAISVYGATPDTHEAVTLVAGSFEKSLNALRLLRERGVRTVVKCPLMKNTIDEFDQAEMLAEDLGAEFTYDITIVPKNDGSKVSLAYRLTEDGLRQVFGKKLEQRPRNRPSDDSHLCGAGLNSLTINPYGEVFPCVQFRIKAGDLRQKHLHDIWRGSEIFLALRSTTFSDLSICSSCDLAPYCVSCPGVALLEDGDWLGPSSIACREARIRKEVLEQKGMISNEAVGIIAQSCKRI